MLNAPKIFSACAACLFALSAAAQESDAPNIAYVYPAGAKAGETVKITLGGRNFDGVASPAAERARVSVPSRFP